MTDLDLEVNKKFLIVKYARLLNHLDKVCVNCRKIALKLIEEGNFDLAHELIILGQQHDISKFYGSEWKYLCEYDLHMDNPEKLVAIKEHVENNSHHPEHYENGINDFDLFDLFEMFFDWKASSERHDDGNIYKSIEINKDRFSMTEQLCQIFKNTAKNLKF